MGMSCFQPLGGENSSFPCWCRFQELFSLNMRTARPWGQLWVMTQEGQSVLRSEYEALHLAVPWDMRCLALPEPPFPGVWATGGGATLAPAHSHQHPGDWSSGDELNSFTLRGQEIGLLGKRLLCSLSPNMVTLRNLSFVLTVLQRFCGGRGKEGWLAF